MAVDPAGFPQGKRTHPSGCDCLTLIRKLFRDRPKGRKGRAVGRRNYFDDPRFPPLTDVDPFADVVPIPFFPADLPRLEQSPFGWTPAELRSALAFAQTKEPIMYVEASNLRLINIGQLIEVVAEGITVMGKLERIKRNPATAKVTLRISGDSVCVLENQRVNIRRSPELHELHLASLGVEDLVDAGVGV